MISLVCFDLGGVLVRIVGGWEEACHRAGLPYHTAVVDPKTRESLVEWSHAFEVGLLTPVQFAGNVATVTPYTPAEVAAIIDAWLIDMYAGAAELLDRLHGAGVRTAVLSNTNAQHWVHLDGRGVYSPLASIPQRFASHLIRARKPNAAAFEHVEAATGVDPRQILYFDDLEANVTAAALQLWQTAHIDPTRDTAPQIEKHLRRHGVI